RQSGFVMAHVTIPEVRTGPVSRLIVLVHGLGRSPASMWALAAYLRARGFRTRCVGYASTRGDITASEGLLRQALAGLGPMDLVGHSLGGLLAARLLRAPEGLEIGRVVQLGSPNRGSPLAEKLGGTWLVRRMCGPAVADLSREGTRPAPHPRIGAIAGTGGWTGMALHRPHDGAVTLRSAWQGAGHRTHVPVLHTLLPLSPAAARRVAEFLTLGRFER
ncbi:MAG: alpha/beta fold hydrolase, partial [Pseudomonadota bacterium]